MECGVFSVATSLSPIWLRQEPDEPVGVEGLTDATGVARGAFSVRRRERVGVLVLEDGRVARFDCGDVPAGVDVVAEHLGVHQFDGAHLVYERSRHRLQGFNQVVEVVQRERPVRRPERRGRRLSRS